MQDILVKKKNHGDTRYLGEKSMGYLEKRFKDIEHTNAIFEGKLSSLINMDDAKSKKTLASAIICIFL